MKLPLVFENDTWWIIINKEALNISLEPEES